MTIPVIILKHIVKFDTYVKRSVLTLRLESPFVRLPMYTMHTLHTNYTIQLSLVNKRHLGWLKIQTSNHIKLLVFKGLVFVALIF